MLLATQPICYVYWQSCQWNVLFSKVCSIKCHHHLSFDGSFGSQKDYQCL